MSTAPVRPRRRSSGPAASRQGADTRPHRGDPRAVGLHCLDDLDERPEGIPVFILDGRSGHRTTKSRFTPSCQTGHSCADREAHDGAIVGLGHLPVADGSHSGDGESAQPTAARWLSP